MFETENRIFFNVPPIISNYANYTAYKRYNNLKNKDVGMLGIEMLRITQSRSRQSARF